jgi:hypothetical protein
MCCLMSTRILRGAQMMAYLFVLRARKVLSRDCSCPCRLVKNSFLSSLYDSPCVTWYNTEDLCSCSWLRFSAAHIDTEILPLFLMSVVQVTFQLLFQTTFEVRTSNQCRLRTSSQLTNNVEFRGKLCWKKHLQEHLKAPKSLLCMFPLSSV